MIPALVPSSFNIVLVRLDGSTVCLEVQGAAAVGRCPACRAASEHIHDRYTRRPLDLPWRGCVVRLWVTVRRFRCLNVRCAQQIFTERLPTIAPAWARPLHNSPPRTPVPPITTATCPSRPKSFCR